MSLSNPETNTHQSRRLPGAAHQAARRRSTEETRARGLPALFQSFASALEALRANKLRSLLTSLGIIIGVGAVIMMIASSEGNAVYINQRLSFLTPNELTVSSGSARAGGVSQGAGTQQTLTQADADAISSQVQGVSYVTPTISASGQVIFRNQNWSTSAQGVYADEQQIGGWQVQEGSFFTNADEQSSSPVAVIGQTVVDNLFTPLGVDPIGQQIRIRNVPFTVVGVLASKGTSGFGDPDNVIYVPFSTAQQRLNGSQYASSIVVVADNSGDLTNVQNAIQQLLDQRHNITNPLQAAFTIQNQSQVLSNIEAIQQSQTLLLVSVASISLLVGGIGIMNIMLVSVTERTREIGIRIAIGARPRDVMIQFLLEALTLSALGGLVGILGGVAGAFINAAIGGKPFALNPLFALLAFAFSAAVGIIFGFYPAQRAARMDPIVALRTE